MDQGNPLKKAPFILITGFLGSGKTSLLTDLLRRYSGFLRIAVIQNEFAPGHADGIMLRRSGKPFELLEINNGSIFCACLLSDFIDRLEPFIRKVNPDVILLEATGLADPVSLGQIMHSGKLSDLLYLASVWCIVDAVNIDKVIDTVARIRQQIRIADIIWINKTDLNPDLSGIRERITGFNPSARMIETTFGSTQAVDFTRYLNRAGGELVETKPDTQTRAFEFHHPTSDVRDPIPEARPNIGSCVIRSNRTFDEKAVSRFLREAAPRLYRVKGFIRTGSLETLLIQTIFDQIEIIRINDYEGPSELIALGPGLNKNDFYHQFLSLQIK